MRVAVAVDRGDLAVLDDVDAEVVGGAGIAPGDRVVPAGAAARLVVGAEDRVAAVRVEVDDRHDLLHLGRRDHPAVEAGQPVGVGGALHRAELVLGLAEHEQPARGEHHVVVEFLRQRLVQRAGKLVDRDRGVLQVVRADDRGVAARIAAAKPALLDDRDAPRLVMLGEVVGGGEPVAARAHDHHIVFRLQLGAPPGAAPFAVVAHRVAGEGKDRVAFHRSKGSPLRFARGTGGGWRKATRGCDAPPPPAGVETITARCKAPPDCDLARRMCDTGPLNSGDVIA